MIAAVSMASWCLWVAFALGRMTLNVLVVSLPLCHSLPSIAVVQVSGVGCTCASAAAVAYSPAVKILHS